MPIAQRMRTIRLEGRNPVTPSEHSGYMIAVTAAAWLVGFSIAHSDLLDAIPGRRVERVIGWVALGSLYVAFKYAPGDAGAVLIDTSQKLAKKFTDLIVNSLPGRPTPPTATIP